MIERPRVRVPASFFFFFLLCGKCVAPTPLEESLHLPPVCSVSVFAGDSNPFPKTVVAA